MNYVVKMTMQTCTLSACNLMLRRLIGLPAENDLQLLRNLLFVTYMYTTPKTCL